MGFNLKDTIKGVTTGALNLLFIKEQIEHMSSERLEACKGCPYNSDTAKSNGLETYRFDYHCTVCGCNLAMKTRYPSARCPLGEPNYKDPLYGKNIEDLTPQWLSLASDEESEKLLKLLEQNK